MGNENFALEIFKELKIQSKRWFLISIIELVLLIGSNIGWWIYESQFETVADKETTTIDAGENGIATYLENSESGDINYGENNKD